MNKLYQSKIFPLIFQILTLIVFMLLIMGGLGISSENPSVIKHLRNTNLSNLIVWSYWWPIIIITAVLVGRHWCTVCPIELISALTVKIGLKRKPPKFIKSGWFITGIYAFILVIAIHTFAIHRTPNLMAFYLLSLIGLAIIISFIFEKRTFCSYFCPVGKLLGLYSLMSIFGLKVKSKNVCKTCKTKDCISKKNKTKLIGRSCTSGIYPAKIEDGRDCILCTQCVKSCPNDNIKISQKKSSFFSFNTYKLQWSEVGMITILLGFICYEILSSWSFSSSVLLYIPNALYKILSIDFIPEKTFNAVILFFIVPTLLVFFISIFVKLTGKYSLIFYIKRTVFFSLPLIAFGHVFKALIKTTSRISYWEFALNQPYGVEYAQNIANKEITINKIEWLNWIAISIGIVGLLIALYFSFKKIKSDKLLSNYNRVIYYTMILINFLILALSPFLK